MLLEDMLKDPEPNVPGSDRFFPIIHLIPGKCPICQRANLCIKAISVDYFVLDNNANPITEDSPETVYLTFCPDPKCGFSSKNFIPTEKGFKFVPEWDDPELYKKKVPLDIINRNIQERTFTGNPFVV